MYLSGERRTEEWTHGMSTGIFGRLSFVALSSLRSLDGEAYPYANAAVLYLVETFGADRFFEFYRSYKGQGGADATRSLLLRIYGFDAAALDLRTRDWIHAAVAAG